MAALLGPGLVLVFCLSQALRDVYFGHVFQHVDFFAVILLTFLFSTLIFTAATLIRTPGKFRKLRGQLPTVLKLNLTTTAAWSCYFFGLSHLDPSIVNTLHSGLPERRRCAFARRRSSAQSPPPRHPRSPSPP